MTNEKLSGNVYGVGNSELAVAVVGTMSSGKSTLINAMLGGELLPARNEATTATIVRIHDDDNADHLWGRAFDKDGNELTKVDPLTKEGIESLNDNPDVFDIDIYGKFAGISSKSPKLVLIDTPGSNNSRTGEHERRINRSIKDSKYKPMVLCVLNATQFETDDDNSLLKNIAEAMREGGRQASDRFIFVLNKADEFDSEKGESVEKKIADTKAYLEKHGIKNPKLFPCSASFARDIRLKPNDLKSKLVRMTFTIPNCWGLMPDARAALHLGYILSRLIEDENLHLSDYADSLSDATKKQLEERIEKAKASGDKRELALLYTGVPAIEMAMSEYAAAYALPSAVSERVYFFKEKINELRLEVERLDELANQMLEA